MDAKTLEIFKDFVGNLAALSKCEQAGQAAIILNSAADQIYSIGINGGPKGGAQCLCNTPGKYTCIHAEAQAIAKCTSTDKDKIMICTTSPCVTCAALIVNTGFKSVFYIKEWHDKTGIEILKQAGIECTAVDDFCVAYARRLEHAVDEFDVHDGLVHSLLSHLNKGPFKIELNNLTDNGEIDRLYEALKLLAAAEYMVTAGTYSRTVGITEFVIEITKVEEKQ